jgi:hypothetical protein
MEMPKEWANTFDGCFTQVKANLLARWLAACEAIHRQRTWRTASCPLASRPQTKCPWRPLWSWLELACAEMALRRWEWQDAFVHAYSKEAGLREALRVTKPGGFLVLCDLHCGDGPDVSAEELHTFAETNMVRPRARMRAGMVWACCRQGRGKRGTRRHACPSMPALSFRRRVPSGTGGGLRGAGGAGGGLADTGGDGGGRQECWLGRRALHRSDP